VKLGERLLWPRSEVGDRHKLRLTSDFPQDIVSPVSVAHDMSGLGSARSVR
jgi:hypothetical protein